MKSLAGMSIVVVGAGVLGLAVAATLRRRSASVVVLDPDEGRTSASAAAAGMIAPAMEAALEDASAERAALYRHAASLWPAFAGLHGLEFHADGADWIGPIEPLASRLRSLGFVVARQGGKLHLPTEGRVSPGAALGALRGGLLDEGRLIAERAERVDHDGPCPVVVTRGRRYEADAVVIAAGWSAARMDAPGLTGILSAITPVKGQIIELSGPGCEAVRRTLRAPDVYVVPVDGGAIAGASMEPGRADLATDPGVVDTIRTSAVAAAPALATAHLTHARAGVRGTTPDGLPLAGATPLPGIFTALAPRRNGWLLAPLVADVLAAALAGETPPPHASALQPDRFGPATAG